MDESTKQKLSRIVKAKWKEPGYKERVSNTLKGHPVSQATIDKANATKERKGLIHKPKPEPILCRCGCGEYAQPSKTWIAGHYTRHGIKHTPESIEKFKKTIRNLPQEVKDAKSKAHSEMMAKKWKDPEYRSKMESMRRDPEYRRSLAESITRKDSSYNKKWIKWHPHISKVDFNDLLKELRVRDSNKCVICGMSDKQSKKTTGKRLSGHHVVPVKVGYKSNLCDNLSNLLLVCHLCHGLIEPGNNNGKGIKPWKHFLPKAYEYLVQFGYKKMLLLKFYTLDK